MAGADGKDILTTGEVARICHVAPRTVSKWFDTGKLRGYRIPGSRDRRIPRRQLEAFMRAHGMPLDELDGGTCRVLVVDAHADRDDRDLARAMAGWERYQFRTAANDFQAGVLAQQFRPHVIVVDVAGRGDEAEALMRNVRTSAELAGAKVVAAVEPAGPRAPELPSCGFDAVLRKPYSPAELTETIERVTNLTG